MSDIPDRGLHSFGISLCLLCIRLVPVHPNSSNKTSLVGKVHKDIRRKSARGVQPAYPQIQ